ncbi:response regulator [Planctobacterium marinum]|uniref:response regulator n=1 Tax=Planctobacterium marinum TaxID=1631968 RepID=UPI001E423EC4|nr:response regulator [Planctobacterium marinum]MCC2607086.1 response regulator [Planctobacterium marinum]
MNELTPRNATAFSGIVSPCRNMSVIVMENVMNMWVAISGMLNNAGFTKVFHADNGFEALEVMASEEIDIIFAEHYLPKQDGLTLLQKSHNN